MNCRQCGRELPDDSRFCPSCGCEVAAGAMPVAVSAEPVASRSDITANRDLMIMYLDELRAMECAVKLLDDKAAQIDVQVYELNNPGKPSKPVRGRHRRYGYEVSSLPFVVWGIFLVALILSLVVSHFVTLEEPLDTLLWLVLAVLFLACFASIFYAYIIYPAVRLLATFYYNRKADGEYKSARRQYEDALGRREATIAANQRHVENLRSAKKNIAESRADAEKIRAELYDVGIVPSFCHNYDDICFIYDYMVSSSQSLDSALRDCELHKINEDQKRSLRNQAEQSLNQMVQISQTKKLIEQNNVLIRKAAEMADTAQDIRRTDKLIAANTDALTWIAGASLFIR